MSEQFLGEIRPFSFGYAPRGWALCNGQLLPINQNQALFSLLGTMYGGNGIQNFALPNLQGRAGMHLGAGFVQGQQDGEEAHTLIQSEIPAHTHPVNCNNALGNQPSASGNFWAQDAHGNAVYNSTGTGMMAPTAIGNTGGNQPHSNMQPYLVVNYCIALQGIFPSRN